MIWKARKREVRWERLLVVAQYHQRNSGLSYARGITDSKLFKQKINIEMM